MKAAVIIIEWWVHKLAVITEVLFPLILNRRSKSFEYEENSQRLLRLIDLHHVHVVGEHGLQQI